MRPTHAPARRLPALAAAATAAGSALLALPPHAARADTAYFSFQGTFSATSGASQDFNLTLPSVAGNNPLTLKTFAFSGGANAAGQSVPAGGIDSILTLFNSSNVQIAQDDDASPSVPAGTRDSLLSPTGTNGGTSNNSLLPNQAPGAYRARLTNFGITVGDGHWAMDLVNAATGANTTVTAATGSSSTLSSLALGATGTANATFALSSGTLTLGSTLTLSTGGVFNLSGGTLNANGNLTLNGGIAHLTGGTFNWAASKTLTVQNGGGLYVVGTLAAPASSTLNVSGSSSLISADDLQLAAGSQVNLTSGGDVDNAYITVGSTPGTAANLTADGAGSFVGAVGSLTVGKSGGAGVVTLRNHSNNFFGSVSLSDPATAGSTGTLNLQSGATATASSYITVATGGLAGQSGSLNITGAGTTLAQSGGAGLTLGAAANSTATFSLSAGASYVGGTGPVTVNKTGTLSVVNASLASNGDINVVGGAASIESGSVLSLAPGKHVTVSAGGKLTADVPLSFSSGQTFTATDPDSLVLAYGGLSTSAGITLQNQAGMGIGHFLNLDGGNSLFDGPGTQTGYTAPSTILSIPSTNSSTATATFSHSASSAFTAVAVPAGASNSNGTLTISSHAGIGAGTLAVGATGTNNTGSVTVTGPGSYLSLTDPSPAAVLIGAPAGTSASLTVADSATLYVPYGGLTLNPTGSLTLDGGTLSLLSATQSGGAFNFLAGQIHFLADANVGTGSLLGTSLTLSPTQSLSVDGTLTVDPFRSLTLAGGSVTTNSLVNDNGVVNFNAGTLTINSTAGVTFAGSVAPFSASSVIPAGATLNVPHNYVTVSPGSLLILDGTLQSNTYGTTNYGELRLYTAPGSAPATLAGGTLNNYNLLDGTGTVSSSLFNQSTGEVRATNAEHLTFTSPSNTNGGKINLVSGGTVEFTGPLTNGPTGTITGRGTLITSALTNLGQLQFSAGLTDVYGPVTTNSGGKIIVSGAGTATFYNALTLNPGSEFRVSPGSTAVFFGPVTGDGQFTGTGSKNFEAGASAPSSLATGGSTFVDAPASLTVDYFRESSLTLSGTAATNPDSPASLLSVLTIDPAASLDLSNNKLVLDYTGPTPLDTIRSYLLTHQLFSSTADTDPQHRLAIAYAEASQLQVSSWATLPVDATAILTKLTYFGDANLDGLVNADDFALFDRGLAKHLTGWTAGDFNYDGTVDAADALLLDSTFTKQAGALPSPDFLAEREAQFGAQYVQELMTAVPEPLALSSTLCPLSSLLLTRRRRRPR